MKPKRHVEKSKKSGKVEKMDELKKNTKLMLSSGKISSEYANQIMALIGQ